jgi:microcystin-dependent protein
MSQPYVGEIRMFAGNFAPAGWALCAGQLMPISENDTLFNLIGTTYGGDGQSTFGLPNLQSRVPLHMGTYQGTTFTIGEAVGVETVTLTTQQIPSHTHSLMATSTGQVNAPAGNAIPASATSVQPGLQTYGGPAAWVGPTTLLPATIGIQGGSQPHENLQPYLTINFIISLFGVFPSQN